MADAFKCGLWANTRSNRESNLREEKRICMAVCSGLFMNAARRSTNASIYRSLPMSLPNLGSKNQSSDMVLLHLHPSVTLNADAPLEHIVYQDLLFGGRVLCRGVLGMDANCLQKYRLLYTHCCYLAEHYL